MKDTSFFKRIFSSRVLPSWTILLFDILIIVFSVFIAYLTRFLFADVRLMEGEMVRTLAVVIPFSLLFFRIFRTYSNILRLSSFVDVMHLFVALTLTYGFSLIVAVLWPIVFHDHLTSIPVLLIAYFVSFMLLATSRMFIKMLYDHFNLNTKPRHMNTYIYGTMTGIDIAKALRTEKDNRFRIVGFVADDPDVVGKVMMGVKVHRNDERLADQLSRDGVQAMIVSPAKAKVLKDSDLADRLLKRGIQIFLAPEVSDNTWTGSLSKNAIKEVQIEDLLGRDPIQINMKEIARHLEGKSSSVSVRRRD